MNRAKIFDLLTNVAVWTRGDERAPHKPLLLLLALARCARGDEREIPYEEIDQPLSALLREFGPPRTQYQPEFPFWHLQSDGIWVVRDADSLERRPNKNNVTRKVLRRENPAGGLTEEIYSALRKDRALLIEAAGRILEAHFPHTMHEDILAAIGLELSAATSTEQTRRNADFRDRVLRAYGRRCAVCGFDLRLGTQDIGLEAAHIKWHQAGGPDIEPNGLALCSLHHKLLDRGAYTFSQDRRVLVSQDVSGSFGLDEYLLRHHGTPLRAPQSTAYLAAPEFLGWHEREVFRGPPRD